MYKQEDWNNIVKLFIYDLSKDVTLDQALQFFASNYTEICQKFADECAEEVVEEEKEESLDVYFERKMKPMWNYVYDLQKQINKIEMSKPLIPSVNAPAWQNPAIGPAYPTTYKVMCDANGNVPLGGNDASKFTPEQIEEWSKIRYGDTMAR